MADLSLKTIARVTQGKLSNLNKDYKVTDYHFDSRLISHPNSLFFALKSETGDGHHYVNRLGKVRGTAAVVRSDFQIKQAKIPLIRVKDTQVALQQLASYVRELYNHVRYIGVTGSAGKTTTKEFIFQILSARFNTFRSHENYNNWIGLPISLLRMDKATEAAVFEMAMSSPGIGEIAVLASILKPDIPVILNVFPVHLEFLKNLDNVARAKAEILGDLSFGQIGLVSGDSPHLKKQLKNQKGHLIYFGRDKNNQVIFKEVIRKGNRVGLVINYHGLKCIYHTRIINRLQLENLFVAIIVAGIMGMREDEIQAALDHIKGLDNRGSIKHCGNNIIIDETYNSNPEALSRALSWVDQEFKNDKIAVLGDMLELGDHEERFHLEVGKYFAGLNYSRLITVGKRAEKIGEGAVRSGYSSQKVHSFTDAGATGAYLKRLGPQHSVLLFKASRGVRLERALEEFCSG